jgi:hypothetical protein
VEAGGTVKGSGAGVLLLHPASVIAPSTAARASTTARHRLQGNRSAPTGAVTCDIVYPVSPMGSGIGTFQRDFVPHHGPRAGVR